jgi:pSer/pThr/pTyr-binding forkhead associated (FHA) protein
MSSTLARSTTTRMLTVEQGPHDGLVVPLTKLVTRIGRSLQADLMFEEPTVSRRHALIVVRDDEALLLDDRSMNGTWLNGERVEEAALHDGDVIKVGGARIRYVERDNAASSPGGDG